jgi:hypothetical protein
VGLGVLVGHAHVDDDGSCVAQRLQLLLQVHTRLTLQQQYFFCYKATVLQFGKQQQLRYGGFHQWFTTHHL